jgi:hypothetical protein
MARLRRVTSAADASEASLSTSFSATSRARSAAAEGHIRRQDGTVHHCLMLADAALGSQESHTTQRHPGHAAFSPRRFSSVSS